MNYIFSIYPVPSYNVGDKKLFIYLYFNEFKFYFSLCIFLRFLLTYLVFVTYNNNYRYILIIFYLSSALGLLYHYLNKKRKIGAFNNTIWWDDLKPLHALLFISTCILLYIKNPYSYMLPFTDTIIGLIMYLLNHDFI